MSNNHTIQRAPRNKQSPYFSISRKTAQDKTLSYEARGLLAYLLSKPDDWKAKISDIQNEHCGRDKARRILTELVDHGYAEAPQRYRDKLGQWVWTSYLFYEEAQPNPSTENPSTDNPLTENTSIYTVESHKEEKKEKEIAPATQDASAPTKKQQHNAMCANRVSC